LLTIFADTLAKILNVDISKIKEDKEDLRKKLKDLSKEELIEQFMKAKVC
jgi:F0F1-type ATP synthase epsilon subunit